MEKQARARSHWKIDRWEAYDFKSKYCFYFNEIYPHFGNEIEKEIFPLYLKLFGNHRKLNSAVFGMVAPDSYHILKKDYRAFSLSASLHKSNYSDVSLESDCIEFIDKAHEILNKYRIISDNYEFWANRWLIHSFYYAIASGTPKLLMYPHLIYPNYSKDLMTELWEDLPINQKNKILEETIHRFKRDDEEDYSEFHEKHLENWDVYFNSDYSPLFLPPPFSFDFESFDIWQDLKQYEERAIAAYREHIKSYLENIQKVLKKHGFKRNKKEDYEQLKWLILWNKYDFQELSDIISVISDYYGIYVSYDAVRKAFNKLKRYNLPVRPFGRNRKNLPQKNQTK
jgi:hypothetical protein